MNGGGRIKGVTVELAVRTQIGVDAFNKPIYSEAWVEVPNVLVAPSEVNDIARVSEPGDLYGRHVTYKLAVPKGDTHDWEETEVRLPAPFGGIYRTVGFSVCGIEDNIPLDWNRQVLVERYG